MTPTSHKGTRAVVSLIDDLQAANGWQPTSAIVARTGIHKDVAPAMLEELASCGWVERREDEHLGTLWLIGPELPRIGLAYQRRLHRAAEELRARTLRLLSDDGGVG